MVTLPPPHSLVRDARGNVGHRQQAEVLAGAEAYGSAAGLGFLIANHEHVGRLHELGVAYLGVHALAASVDVGADACGLQL